MRAISRNPPGGTAHDCHDAGIGAEVVNPMIDVWRIEEGKVCGLPGFERSHRMLQPDGTRRIDRGAL